MSSVTCRQPPLLPASTGRRDVPALPGPVVAAQRGAPVGPGRGLLRKTDGLLAQQIDVPLGAPVRAAERRADAGLPVRMPESVHPDAVEEREGLLDLLADLMGVGRRLSGLVLRPGLGLDAHER